MTLLEALNQLGDTEKAVAETLRDRRHYGRRNDGCGCPVAKYLEAVLHGSWIVSPGFTQRWDVEHKAESCATPPPVASFITAFDAGNHPELNMGNPACPSQNS